MSNELREPKKTEMRALTSKAEDEGTNALNEKIRTAQLEVSKYKNINAVLRNSIRAIRRLTLDKKDYES